MKLIQNIVFFYASLGMVSITLSSNGITYAGLWANRFGDYLVSYSECRWLSYIHNLEFYYNPFKYGDQLIASICHKQINDHTQKRTIGFGSALQINSRDDDVLYIGDDHMISDVQIDWDDRSFVKLLKEEISPINLSSKQTIEIPANHYSIALHVRRGEAQTENSFRKT